MTEEEKRHMVPCGELIIPNGHLILRSLYQFNNEAEVYAFLHACKREGCSVCFQNEDINMVSNGALNVPKIAISMYMHLKENPRMVEEYLRYTMKVASKEWAMDRVEVA